jgi:hypothetical protein
MLVFRTESMLGLKELLELRRLRSLWLLGLSGLSPDCRAKRFRMSVKETTPVKRPEIRLPGSAAAETAGKAPARDGDAGVELIGDERTACEIEGVESGVEDDEDDGDASTTHIRCERVATSLATVCARVERGLT